MIHEKDRPDHNQPAPAPNDSALERDDLQRVQDQAGIAGEPQPTDTAPHDPKPRPKPRPRPKVIPPRGAAPHRAR